MKDKILTLIIGIIIGAVIMGCVFLVYTKNTEKDKNDVKSTTVDNFNNQGFPQDGKMRDGGFERGQRGDFNRNFESDENMPEPPSDENLKEDQKDLEPPAKPEDIKDNTSNTEK